MKVKNLTELLDMRRVAESENYFKEVVKNMEALVEHNQTLRKENEELKDEHYKDKELQRLSDKVESLQKRYSRAFEPSKKANEWMEEHSATKHPAVKEELRKKPSNFHYYTFSFTPDHLGVAGEVTCSCGKSFSWFE